MSVAKPQHRAKRSSGKSMRTARVQNSRVVPGSGLPLAAQEAARHGVFRRLLPRLGVFSVFVMATIGWVSIPSERVIAGTWIATPSARLSGGRALADWRPSPVAATPAATAKPKPSTPTPNAATSLRQVQPSAPTPTPRAATTVMQVQPKTPASTATPTAKPPAPTPTPTAKPPVVPPNPVPAGGPSRWHTTPAGYTAMSQLLTTDRLKATFSGGLPKERGRWEEVRFHSRSLGQESRYVVWLPPGYDSPTHVASRYPSLYLLHGAGGAAEPGQFGYEEWRAAELGESLDRLLAHGLIQPLLVVLPHGAQGYWMNHANGGPRWGDLVAADLVADADKRFRTLPVREQRAIGGLSMGAHGALQLALRHPAVFGVAGAHSPPLRPYEDPPPFFGPFFGDRQWWAQNDPLSLVQNTDSAQRLRTWIDVGHADQWRARVELLRAAYLNKRAPLEFHVLEGSHTWEYFRTFLPEYLRWYASTLHAGAKTP